MKTKSAFTLIEIMIVVAIIGVLAAVAIPGLKNAIEKSRTRACALNRRTIEAAKAQWALENKKPLEAVPSDDDLFGKTRYIEHKPDCPASGIYNINSIDEKCTCSLPVHAN